MRTKTMLLSGALMICALGPAALAQPVPAGAAESLFRDGKKLMDEGKFAEACTAFDGSYRKDPAVSTLLNLANCREKNHQYASAWGHFIEAERQTRGKADQSNLNQTAHDRAAALEGRLSHLIINVPDDSRVDGLEVSRNGVPVDTAEWNSSIPVDGGTYKIEGKAPLFEAWSTSVTIGDEKDTKSVNVPKFKALPPSKIPPPGAGAGGEQARRSSFTGKRKGAVAAWAAGAIGLGAGVALELSARSTYDLSKDEADDQKQQDLYDSANQKRLFATVAASVGAVAIGAGVYLWVTGKPVERAQVSIAPSISHDGGGVVVLGRF